MCIRDSIHTHIQLRAYLTEPLIGQIPHLAELQRYLEHLSFMEPPPIKRDLILEQVCTLIRAVIVIVQNTKYLTTSYMLL